MPQAHYPDYSILGQFLRSFDSAGKALGSLACERSRTVTPAENEIGSQPAARTMTRMSDEKPASMAYRMSEMEQVLGIGKTAAY